MHSDHLQINILLNRHSVTYLFSPKQHFCIVAAHCFAKNTRGNALNPPSRYKIGVGKYYLGYSDPRDAMSQYSEVGRKFLFVFLQYFYVF